MSVDARQAILDAAIEQISRSGEASVRLRDIAKVVGIKEPSIYYYFANREELVVASHVRRFEINLSQTLQPFVDILASCSTSTEFLEGLTTLYRNSFLRARTTVRAARSEIVGSAYFRPELQRELAAMARTMFQPALELMNNGKTAGWIRPSLDMMRSSIGTCPRSRDSYFPRCSRTRRCSTPITRSSSNRSLPWSMALHSVTEHESVSHTKV